MLTQDQIQKIVSENDYLSAQLKELNEMLALREEEIEILTSSANDTTQLRSQLEMQGFQTESLKDNLTLKQQQAIGAAIREKELEDELVDSSKLLKQFAQLQQAYTLLLIQNKDLEERLNIVNIRNEELTRLVEKK